MSNDRANIEVHVSALIDALYETLLLRHPDPDGRAANIKRYVDLATDSTVPYTDIIRHFLLSIEFSTISFPNFVNCYYSSSMNNTFTLDHSQYGEIDLLIRLMINAAATHRFVVDVGANGRERSNSYDLLRFFRWKGILIEANPSLIPHIERDFAGLDIQIINYAVSDFVGDGTLYIGINSDISSLSQQNTKNWGDIKGTIPVKIKLLSEILRSSNVPLDFDLLSIDIEGYDIRVFNEIVEAGYRPRWVIIEASLGFSTKSLDDLPFSELIKHNYGIVGQTVANLILCHGVHH